MAGDPYWDDVVLRLTLDETLVDSSPSAHTVLMVQGGIPGTDSGSPVWQTGKFGQAAQLGPVNNTPNRLEITGSLTDFNFGAGDFTVEWWVYGVPSTGRLLISCDNFVTGQRAFNLGLSTRTTSGANVNRYSIEAQLWSDTNVAMVDISGGLEFGPTGNGYDEWTHLCFERQGGNFRVYRNGVMIHKVSSLGTTAVHDATTPLMVGGRPTFSGGGRTAGVHWFDDVRITKGVARYGTDLGFSVPTAPYPTSGGEEATGGLGTTTVVPPEGVAEYPDGASGGLGTVTMSVGLGEATETTSEYASGDLGTVILYPPTVSTVFDTLSGMNVLSTSNGIPETTQAGLEALAKTETILRSTQMGLLVLARGGETPLRPDPLTLTDQGRREVLVQRLVNMYIETTPEGPAQNARYQRPGLKQVAQYGAGPIKATFKHKGFRYTVSGNSVWRDFENIGTVIPGENVRWAISDEEVVIVSGGYAHYVTTTEVEVIDDPDLPKVRDVVVLAGRFVYFHDDESGMYSYSDVGDAQSIDGLSFASAEAQPDEITGAAVSGEAMVIFGTATTEWQFGTTNADAPFQRSQGRTYDKGCLCINTVQLGDNALTFVGDDRMVYRAAQVPLRISTHQVEDRLRKQTLDQFRQNSAFVISFGGHTFYVLNIVGQGTWAFDYGYKSWAEWRSWEMDRFRVSVADREGFMGDAYTGALMSFDGGQYTDFGNVPIERVVSTFQPLKSGTLRNFQLALHCEQGVGLLGSGHGSEPVVEMRFSDHRGWDWGPWMQSGLGAHGQRGKEALAQWSNLGTFPSPGRAFEFRCTDPVAFTPFMVSINEFRP